MTDTAEERRGVSGNGAGAHESPAASDGDFERALARKVSLGVPALTLVAAIAVGLVLGVAPGLLVVAAGALLGVVLLFWASLRTLSGDAPVAEGLVMRPGARRALVGEAPGERKRRVLRALKDLDHEHEVGKIDDADYARIAANYRAEAKDLLRAMDLEVDPQRARAEEIAVAHLKKKGLVHPSPGATTREAPAPSEAETERVTVIPSVPPEQVVPTPRAPFTAARVACRACDSSNEPDASFCKKCGARLGGDEVVDASA